MQSISPSGDVKERSPPVFSVSLKKLCWIRKRAPRSSESSRCNASYVYSERRATRCLWILNMHRRGMHGSVNVCRLPFFLNNPLGTPTSCSVEIIMSGVWPPLKVFEFLCEMVFLLWCMYESKMHSGLWLCEPFVSVSCFWFACLRVALRVWKRQHKSAFALLPKNWGWTALLINFANTLARERERK